MKIKDILREDDINSYNKIIKIGNKKKKEKLSKHDLKELMSHSRYKRHRGAVKQVE